VFLIEDCCDALGATVGGQHVGTFGDIGTLSFYPAHHITMGEGGAVFTNDSNSTKSWNPSVTGDAIAIAGPDRTTRATSGSIGNWAICPRGTTINISIPLGYNLKITDMQAAVGVAQLEHLDDFIAARRRNFARLREGLAHLEDIFVLPEATAGSDPSWFGFALTLRKDAPIDRHGLLLELQAKNIGTRLLFGGNLVRQPYMKGRNFRVSGTLDNADAIVDRTFWIGVYPALGAQEIDFMIETLDSFCRGDRRIAV